MRVGLREGLTHGFGGAPSVSRMSSRAIVALSLCVSGLVSFFKTRRGRDSVGDGKGIRPMLRGI